MYAGHMTRYRADDRLANESARPKTCLDDCVAAATCFVELFWLYIILNLIPIPATSQPISSRITATELSI
jgi:hypothetical protein